MTKVLMPTLQISSFIFLSKLLFLFSIPARLIVNKRFADFAKFTQSTVGRGLFYTSSSSDCPKILSISDALEGPSKYFLKT